MYRDLEKELREYRYKFIKITNDLLEIELFEQIDRVDINVLYKQDYISIIYFNKFIYDDGIIEMNVVGRSGELVTIGNMGFNETDMDYFKSKYEMVDGVDYVHNKSFFKFYKYRLLYPVLLSLPFCIDNTLYGYKIKINKH